MTSRKQPCLKLSGYLAEAALVDSFDGVNEDMLEEELPGIDWDTHFLATKGRHYGLAKSLEFAAASRITERTRLLVFAEARHPRLGAASPARVLHKDCLRVIWAVMQTMEYLVTVGVRSDGSACAARLSLSSFVWSSLPPPPLCVVRASVVPLAPGKFVVVGGYAKKHKSDKNERTSTYPNRKVLLFENNKWCVLDRLPALNRVLQSGAVVEHNGGLIVLGGTTQERSRESGFSDVFIDLEKKTLLPFPLRPNFKKFWKVIKTIKINSFLIVFSTGYWCVDLMSAHKYCFTTPKNPAVCCNQLMCLDLNNLDNGWFELPWLSKAHMAECDFYLQGSKLVINGGGRNDITCPCCGPMKFRNPNSYFLDLAELTTSPFWRFLRDEEKFDHTMSGLVSEGVTVECAKGTLFLGGEEEKQLPDHNGSESVVRREIRLGEMVVAKFNAAKVRNNSVVADDEDFDEEAPDACVENAFAVVVW